MDVCYLGEELEQLFCDAPTAELPLSMLSDSDEEGVTAVDLAIRSGATESKCNSLTRAASCIRLGIVFGALQIRLRGWWLEEVSM